MLDPKSADLESSWLSQAQSRFDDKNADLVLKTRSLLNRIVTSAELHSRLLNTLSMLEHMGSHKIMLTQHARGTDQSTLRHLAEECHHAFFMKRQAEKAAGRELAYDSDELLAPAAARMYFRRLEATMVADLGELQRNDCTYLYMSMVIEFRAVWFYSLYQQVLTRHDHPLSLRRLLGEEQNHLTEMAGRLTHAGELSEARVDAFTGAEHVLYGRFLDSLQQSVN